MASITCSSMASNIGRAYTTHITWDWPVESTPPNAKRPSRPDTLDRGRHWNVGEWQDTIQPGCQGARPCQTILIRTGDIGSDELGSHLINSDLNVLAVNIRGIMYHGRSEQDHLLIIKHKVLIAILSETETTHSYSATTHIEGFRALCPPKTVTGPPGKEVGVIMMVSDLGLSSIQRPDINGADTVQTGLTELTHLELIVGGVYHRNRPSQSDLELEEMA